jgi:hypothetical protein
MEFDIFKKKLNQLVEKLCDENFELDLRESNFSTRMKERLSRPCYNKFAKVDDVYGNLDGYLTKQNAFYYLLQERGFKRERDILEIKINKSYDGHHFGDFVNNYI